MNTKEFFAALELLEKEKGISKDIIIEAFEHALISAYKKNFNQATNVKVEINEHTGTVKLYQQKTVTEDVTRPQEQISLAEAMRINPHYEEGDIIKIDIDNYSLDFVISEEELNRRKANFVPKQTPGLTGYLKRYQAMVSSSSRGAILEIPQ